MDDSNICEQSQIEEGDTRAEEPDEDQASDGDDSIIGETLDICIVKDRTRSKSKRYNIPTPIYPSESEDEMLRPPRRKKAQRGSCTVRAGVNAKFIRRNSNQFPSTASKRLQARRVHAGLGRHQIRSISVSASLAKFLCWLGNFFCISVLYMVVLPCINCNTYFMWENRRRLCWRSFF